MSSIKINNAINSLNTEAIVNNFFANAKRAFQPFVREQVKQLRSMQLFKDNLNFKYSGEDLLKASYKTFNNLSILESNGYKNCSEKYFLNAEYNCIQSSEILHSFKSNIEPQVIPFLMVSKPKTQITFLMKIALLFSKKQLIIYFCPFVSTTQK